MRAKKTRSDPWRSPVTREEKFAPMGLFTRSLVLFVANELGVFECLSNGPLPVEKVKTKLRTDPKGTRVLLDALVALKYLRKSEGRYENEPESSRYLTEGSPDYVGAMLSHSYNSLRRWLCMEDIIRKGQKHKHKLPEFQATDVAERKRMKKFAVGLDQSSRPTAAVVADILNLEGVETLLDLGGGAGTYSIAFAKKWPSLKPVVFEMPVPARVARRQVKTAGLGERVRVVTGDFMTDDLGADCYDAAFISNIIHIFSAEKNRQLIHKVHRALRKGGMIIIKDMLVNDGREGPFYPLMFALTMLMFTDGGDTYMYSEVKDWLREAGFSRIRRRVAVPQESFLLIGYKR